jgi:hypothetical protein
MTPSLYSDYRSFFTNMGHSAPLLHFGILILVGSPLGFLPLHRSQRFPRSLQKLLLSSRHLHAGHRLDSIRLSSTLVPELLKRPGFDDGYFYFGTSTAVQLYSSP